MEMLPSHSSAHRKWAVPTAGDRNTGSILVLLPIMHKIDAINMRKLQGGKKKKKKKKPPKKLSKPSSAGETESRMTY